MQADSRQLNGRQSSGFHDDDEHSKQRKRVSRACVRCRTKKDKCDGLRPSCSACAASGQICSYEPTTKKRGLPEGYVRGLEKLWAVCMGKIEGLEDAVTKITRQHQEELWQIWNHETVGEDLHTTWKESRVLAELETLLSGVEKDTHAVTKRKRDEENDGEEGASDDSDAQFLRHANYRIQETSNQAEEASALKRRRVSQHDETEGYVSLPSEASQLIEYYFTYTHCWFPILNRPQVLRSFYEVSKGSTIKTASGDLAVLWALLALTVHQRHNLDMDNPTDERSDCAINSTLWKTKSLSLIPRDSAPYEVGHCHALLLLAILEIGLGRWCGAWTLIGHATRVALVLGLPPLGSRTGLPAVGSKERTVPALQGCFILDTLIALHLDLPPHLRRSDLQYIGYSEEDGHDEWQPWTTMKTSAAVLHEPAFIISSFNRLCDVFILMNDILTCNHPPGPSRTTYLEQTVARLKEIQLTFPTQAVPIAQLPPHLLYLRLFHHSASILLLQRLQEAQESSHAPNSPLATLACDVLIILTEFAQSPALGLPELPPVLENPVRAACYAAIATRPAFGSTPGLPSYAMFARKMTDHVSAISTKWTVFRSLSHLWHSRLESHPQVERSSSLRNVNVADDSYRDNFPFLRPGTFETSFPSADWTSKDMFVGKGMSDSRYELHNSASRPTDANAWGTQFENPAPVQAPDTEMQSRDFAHFSDDNVSILTPLQGRDAVMEQSLDAQMSGFDDSSPAGLAMPTVQSSPSFQGDDVDAIFHNLVQLDANEWTDNRPGTFKEFGFVDDLTFQAFCDDPERMVPSSNTFDQNIAPGLDFWQPDVSMNSGNMPASSEQAGWWA